MSTSIVPQLVKKDFLLMRKMIFTFFMVSLISVVVLNLLFGYLPNWVVLNFTFILLLGPAATCGIVLLMKTNVFEKEKATQSFIMSLPVTVKEFTMAKILINLSVFAAFWLVVSGVAFYFSFSRSLFPLGTVPFITIVLLGVFVAYTCILSVSLIFQSLGITVLSIMLFQFITSAYLWGTAYLGAVSNYIYGAEVVWNITLISIVILQIFVAISVILITFIIQNKKRDFI
jgi:hypothetical protein